MLKGPISESQLETRNSSTLKTGPLSGLYRMFDLFFNLEFSDVKIEKVFNLYFKYLEIIIIRANHQIYIKKFIFEEFF
jgi:hypothetical protein